MRNSQKFLLLMILARFTCSSAAQTTESVLHRFTEKWDGAVPMAPLISDKDGNLYGTTLYGGDLRCTFPWPGCGTVFELNRNAEGKWKFRTLYEFHGGLDGANPEAGLVFDSSGNLYGTTSLGGNEDVGVMGDGAVFELQHTGNHWSETVLHRFGGRDGAYPAAPLVWGPDGALYGTTVNGGVHICRAFHLNTAGCGVVFRLELTSAGWAETVLHIFKGLDGAEVYAGLKFDAAGNLYGTTWEGGTGGGLWGGGVIFEMSRSGRRWTETTLYNFPGYLGNPEGEVVIDAFGNLYGATEFGGDYGYGSVFELSASGNAWSLTTLHSFDWVDGLAPHAGIVVDSAGNIYGTAIGSLSGSCLHGCGLVYMLDKSNAWAETVLHSFEGGRDGAYPWANLLLDNHGDLYGTTAYGGDENCTAQGFPGCGTVYEIRRHQKH